MTEHNEHHTLKADEIPCEEISDPAVLSKTPLVSVVMPTYNHEPYIAQAIEGALMQKTNLPYEVLIGEDGSSDGTREICKEYAAKYPDKIRLFLNDRNNVIYINGRPTGRWNPINLLRNARGKYIAFCEGDDYWTDPDKLQKQVDFLEANPEYGLVHTDYNEEYVKSERRLMNIYKKRELENKTELTFNDLLIENLIDTPTVCVRTKTLQDAIRSLSDDVTSFLMGDYPLWLEISRNNKIYRFNESFATYRILEESASHFKDIKKKFQFIDSSYDIKYYFISKYGCSENVRNRIDFNYQIFLIRYAFLLNKKELALKAVNIRDGLSCLEIKDKLLYYGATNNIIRFGVKIIRKIYLLLKRKRDD